VIDPACSLVFEAEGGESEAMRCPPRSSGEPFFGAGMLSASVGLGVAALVAVALVYAWALRTGMAQGEMRALAFAAIVIGNLGLIFANRSRFESIVATLARPNPVLWWVALAALVALALTIYLPPFAAVFRFEPLGAADAGIALAAGLAGAAWSEIWKRRSSGARSVS
jgi:Ca2+-transporting ATPase